MDGTLSKGCPVTHSMSDQLDIDLYVFGQWLWYYCYKLLSTIVFYLRFMQKHTEELYGHVNSASMNLRIVFRNCQKVVMGIPSPVEWLLAWIRLYTVAFALVTLVLLLFVSYCSVSSPVYAPHWVSRVPLWVSLVLWVSKLCSKWG